MNYSVLFILVSLFLFGFTIFRLYQNTAKGSLKLDMSSSIFFDRSWFVASLMLGLGVGSLPETHYGMGFGAMGIGLALIMPAKKLFIWWWK